MNSIYIEYIYVQVIKKGFLRFTLYLLYRSSVAQTYDDPSYNIMNIFVEELAVWAALTIMGIKGTFTAFC